MVLTVSPISNCSSYVGSKTSLFGLAKLKALIPSSGPRRLGEKYS